MRAKRPIATTPRLLVDLLQPRMPSDATRMFLIVSISRGTECGTQNTMILTRGTALKYIKFLEAPGLLLIRESNQGAPRDPRDI